ncbi:unnamed protein product [Clavelina lepadiformis]|uniref:Uncharacterized protein n=1 Tax=Clavelina lepadiformis TaxID=159417 RepID=A0ABP0FGH4_CLALP
MVKYNKATKAVLSDQQKRQVLFINAHTTIPMKATFFSPTHLYRLKPMRETNRKQDTDESALDHIETLEAVERHEKHSAVRISHRQQSDKPSGCPSD